MCGAFAFPVMDKKAPGCEMLAVRRLPALVHSKLPSLSTPDVENRGGGSLSTGKGSDPDQCSRTVDRISPRFETPALQCSRPLVHTKFPSLSTSGVENNRRTWTKNHHVRKRPHCKPRGHLSTPSSHRFPRAVWKTRVARSGSRPPWWARGRSVPTKVGIYQSQVPKQQGPPMAGPVVHVLQCGVPYSALPPNLWVYCRLMVRPTLSNQDTS